MCGGSGFWSPPGLFFMYGIDFSLTALQTQQGNITILDKDFRWMYAIAKSTSTFQFQMFDSARSTRPFQSVTVAASTQQTSQGIQNVNFWGTAQNPFPIPIPYDFPVRDNVKIVVTDTSNANNTINITLVGGEIEPALPAA
jgi:hypothetical protein